jgi:phenylacetate-coenzyme A ligase PaaK-like adenylate-forming protein
MPMFLKHWDQSSLAEQRSVQGQRLRAYLRNQVVPFSPHYRRKFAEWKLSADDFHSLADLRRIPFTTKQDLLPGPENPKGALDFVLAPTEELIRTALPKSQMLRFLVQRLRFGEEGLKKRLTAEYSPASMIFTTGRSSGSVPFFVTLYDQDILIEAGRRITDVLELVPGRDRTVSLFPYAPHLAFWQVAYCGMGTGTLTLNTGGGRVMPTEKLIGAIETLKATCVVGMPGFFYHLLRRAVAEGRDFSSVRTIALGGENVPPGLKRKIVDTMQLVGAKDVRVASVLGFTESRMCWTECAHGERTGFHTYPDLSIFEIIDPKDGRLLGEGETGELVYTGLDGRGSAVLRYRTGDVVEGGLVESEPCPGCKRRVPRIMSNLQRVSNVKSLEIGKIKGTLVNMNTLSEMFSGDPEIEEWQLEIRKKNDDPFDVDEVVLRCALKGREDPEGFKRRIQEEIYARSEVHVNEVRIEPLADVLRRIGMETLTKEERIVDRRKRAGASTPTQP